MGFQILGQNCVDVDTALGVLAFRRLDVMGLTLICRFSLLVLRINTVLLFECLEVNSN